MRTSHDIDCLVVAFQLVYLGGGLLARGVRRAYVKLRRDDSNELEGQPHFCLLSAYLLLIVYRNHEKVWEKKVECRF
jgi:hypothetical protein